MALNAVLFDIDGVLLDSRLANYAFYQDILTFCGYAQPTRNQCDAVFHLTRYDALRRLSGEEDEDKMTLLWNAVPERRYPVELTKVPPFAQRVVDILSTQYKLGIVTNRRRPGVDEFFGIFGRRKSFKAVVTLEDILNPKPDPESLLKALSLLRVRAGEAVYVGDSASDVSAARRAGLRIVVFGPMNAAIRGDRNVASFAQLEAVLGELEAAD